MMHCPLRAYEEGGQYYRLPVTWRDLDLVALADIHAWRRRQNLDNDIDKGVVVLRSGHGYNFKTGSWSRGCVSGDPSGLPHITSNLEMADRRLVIIYRSWWDRFGEHARHLFEGFELPESPSAGNQ